MWLTGGSTYILVDLGGIPPQIVVERGDYVTPSCLATPSAPIPCPKKPKTAFMLGIDQFY